MKNAVVTGANGFVGSAVVRELAKKNIHIYAVVRSNAKYLERIGNIENVDVVYCDAANYATLKNKLTHMEDGCFFHFAWEGTSGTKRGDEVIQLRNVQYSIDALRAAKEIGCNRFLFASSVMEKEIETFVNVEKPLSVNYIYSSAKSAANQMCRVVADNIDIEYVSVMISNIYGPGEHSFRLINTSIRKLLAGEHASFSEGKQQYDFIYIDDAARSFVAVAERGKNRKIYYLGSRYSSMLKDYLIQMRDIVAPEAELGLGEIEFDGISLDYSIFDRNAIERDTGCKPLISFAEGILYTVDWIKENG